jgi:hypothetical protein
MRRICPRFRGMAACVTGSVPGWMRSSPLQPGPLLLIRDTAPTVTRLRIWRLGVRIPRGAPPSPRVSGPVRGRLPGGRGAGPRPNCDHVGGHSLRDCDHVRPPSLMRASLLPVSAAVESPRVVGCGRRPRPTSTSRLAHPNCTARVGPRVRAQLMVLLYHPHAGLDRAAKTPAGWAFTTMCRSRLRTLWLLLVEHDGQQRSHRCNGAGQQLKVGGLLAAEPTIGEPE